MQALPNIGIWYFWKDAFKISELFFFPFNFAFTNLLKAPQPNDVPPTIGIKYYLKSNLLNGRFSS